MIGEILYHLHRHFRTIVVTGAAAGAGAVLWFAGQAVLGGLKTPVG